MKKYSGGRSPPAWNWKNGVAGVPVSHGDFWGKLPDGFCPEQDRFRYGVADEPLDLDEHFHRQKGVTTAGKKIIVDRHSLGLEQPPP